MTILRFLLILLLILNALAFAAIGGWLGGEPATGEAARIATQLHPERIRLANETGATGLAPAAESTFSAEVVTQALPTPEAVATQPTLTNDAPAPGAVEDAASPEARDTEPPTAPTPAPASAIAPTSAEPTAPSPVPPTLCQAWSDLSTGEADQLTQRLRRIGITAARSRSETPDAWWVRIPPQRNRSEAERRVVELNLLGVTDTFIVQEAGPTQHAVSLGVFKTEARARVLLGQLRDRGVTNPGIEPRTTTTYRIQASIPARELRTVESAAPGLRGRRQACAPR